MPPSLQAYSHEANPFVLFHYTFFPISLKAALKKTFPENKPGSLRHLHAQLSRATTTAPFGPLISLLSLSQYTNVDGELIYCWTL